MKVVIADDSPLILVRLKERISMYDKVEIAGMYNNGDDALSALKELNPQLAIVDIQMPGQSGLKILQEIRLVNKSMKFIILTFYPSDFYQKWALKEGADYFFSKVDDFNKIFTVIDELLEIEETEKGSVSN
jgi:two-component system response regulator DesR